jgi:site-specific recombinase XerD
MVTKKTGEPVVIPATKRLLRLFEFMKRHPLTTEQLKDINENIGEAMADLEINKHITSHCGRKTFAVELCANSGISCEVCATLMAIDMQTCVDSYYDVTEEKIGKEVELFWKNF